MKVDLLRWIIVRARRTRARARGVSVAAAPPVHQPAAQSCPRPSGAHPTCSWSSTRYRLAALVVRWPPAHPAALDAAQAEAHGRTLPGRRATSPVHRPRRRHIDLDARRPDRARAGPPLDLRRPRQGESASSPGRRRTAPSCAPTIVLSGTSIWTRCVATPTTLSTWSPDPRCYERWPLDADGIVQYGSAVTDVRVHRQRAGHRFAGNGLQPDPRRALRRRTYRPYSVSPPGGAAPPTSTPTE
ncbi:hypothetical protein HBB16_10145 [Pseudonocardia sp. MCCB 268]|nr:hypothetical protein [Pseudonocardia cytotoxica]